MDFKKVKISDVCDINNGFAFKSENYVQNNGARVIRITNVQKGIIVDNDPKYYPFEKLEGLEKYMINEGDIMMSLTGNVGRVGSFPSNMLPAYINQRICRIKPVSEKLDKKFLFHILNSDDFENMAINASAGAAQLNLSTNWVSNFEIPLPSLEIQKAIAEKLDKADALRKKDQELLAQYDELAQAIFIDMFGDPVLNEKGWEICSVESVCDRIFGGGTPSKSNSSFYIGNIPWVTPKDMKFDFISDSIDHINEEAIEKSSAKLIPANSLLMVIRSGILKHTLPLGINVVDVTINQDMKAFIPNDAKTNVIFLKGYFKAIESHLLTKVRAVTADNIEFSQIRSLDFILPPISLQNQFAEKIKNIEAQKAIVKQQAEESENLFQALLQESFSF